MWEFIDNGENTGKFNMDFDIELVERCRKENISFLRFYKWKPYSISLGYNQSKLLSGQRIDSKKCEIDGIDIVQRPTGGRAVLHSEELTYSYVTKTSKPVKTLYREISQALINGLKLIDEENDALQNISLTVGTPDLLKLTKTGMYNLCFNTAIKDEINLNGKKLIGSAQRDFGDVVLQHGSILLGDHHKQIVNYLMVDEKVKMRLKKEIDEKTICLNEILNRTVTYEEAAAALIKGFKNTFNLEFSNQLQWQS